MDSTHTTAIHPTARISPSAEIDPGAAVGADTSIWQLAHVRSGAQVGPGCVVGRGVYIGPDVRVGANCKIQNYALIYEPAHLGDGVFIGPAVVLTNDQYPRAINPDGSHKSADDWDLVGVTIDEGASIGARAVCVAPVRIGAWAMVAAGAVVIHDVPAHALIAGTPGRRIGWVGRSGRRLVNAGEGRWLCPISGEEYREEGDALLPVGAHREP